MTEVETSAEYEHFAYMGVRLVCHSSILKGIDAYTLQTTKSVKSLNIWVKLKKIIY